MVWLMRLPTFIWRAYARPDMGAANASYLPPSCTVVFDVLCVAHGTADAGQTQLIMIVVLIIIMTMGSLQGSPLALSALR